MPDRVPVARAEMLIRKPIAEVFEALVNPEITTKFWFSRGSARLDAVKHVTWEWGTFGFMVDVNVLEIEKNQRILIEWSAFGKPTIVEWTFTPVDGATYVTAMNRGFAGDSPQQMKAAIDSTEGFTLVLVGLKAWLEHGMELNLVSDRHPDPHVYTARRA